MYRAGKNAETRACAAVMTADAFNDGTDYAHSGERVQSMLRHHLDSRRP
jgi:hypothetical protein